MPSPQRTAQTPPWQLCPLAQAALVKPLPSLAHIDCAAALAQTAPRLPGVHARAAQRPPAAQNCIPAAQSLSPTHSTQIPCAVSQTSPRSLHCREEVHILGRAMQLFSTQR
jgi:hypothetical protein